MSFTAEDGVRLTAQVSLLTQQITALVAQNASVAQAFDVFKAQATQELQNLRNNTGNQGGGGGDGTATKKLQLMEVKDYKPSGFSGERDRDYKPWRKKFLTYLNLQAPGFREALEWC